MHKLDAAGRVQVASAKPQVLWELHGITKDYPGMRANDGIALQLRAGEIHGLLGENGCGKSTLIKILSGVEQPTSGTIFKDGQPITLRSVEEARSAGIATVFQEFSLVPELSVAENIHLGRLPRKLLGLVDWKHVEARSAATLFRLGLGEEVDVCAKVGSLSVAQQQLVEIAKAVSTDARTLILDEPTAALAHGEIERLHVLLRHLKALGHAILYVSHRLDEVVALIDVATILKDGKRVSGPGEVPIAVRPIVAAMIGQEVEDYYPRGSSATAEVVLDMQGLGAHHGIEDVSLAVRRGEIVGIAGVMGSGRTSLLHALFGLNPTMRGSITLRGCAYRPRGPREAIDAGMALVPESRKVEGLFFNLGGPANMSIATLDRITHDDLIVHKREMAAFADLSQRMEIARHAAKAPVGALSGGNQQKILLARWVFRDSDLLLLDEPTRGVDVGARAAIYQLLRALTASGKSIVLVSSDWEELLAISDRIALMRAGRLSAVCDAAALDEHSLSVALADQECPR